MQRRPKSAPAAAAAAAGAASPARPAASIPAPPGTLAVRMVVEVDNPLAALVPGAPQTTRTECSHCHTDLDKAAKQQKLSGPGSLHFCPHCDAELTDPKTTCCYLCSAELAASGRCTRCGASSHDDHGLKVVTVHFRQKNQTVSDYDTIRALVETLHKNPGHLQRTLAHEARQSLLPKVEEGLLLPFGDSPATQGPSTGLPDLSMPSSAAASSHAAQGPACRMCGEPEFPHNTHRHPFRPVAPADSAGTGVLQIAFLAASQDAAYRQEAEAQVAHLERQGHLRLWSHGKVAPGSIVEDAYREAIDHADRIVCLLSVDFIADDKLMDWVDRAVRRGDKVVQWVMLRPCTIWRTVFEQRQALGGYGLKNAITLRRSRDEAWQEIMDDLLSR